VARLHAQVRFVCQTAVDCDSDSHRFPKDWLFSSRWGKAKKATDFVLVSRAPRALRGKASVADLLLL